VTATAGRAAETSLRHLDARLGVLDAHVRAAVQRRRAVVDASEEPFRGLYVSEEDVDRLLAGPDEPLPPLAGADARPLEEALAAVAAAGDDLRLRDLALSFELEPVDVELLLVALAPDLDARFERLYGYLHDDVSRRRASVGLALELAGSALGPAAARHRLVAGPLVTSGLVIVDDGEHPFLTRSLRVPDRVAMHLLGDDHVDPALVPFLARVHPQRTGDPSAVARVLGAGAMLVYVRDGGSSAGRSLAAAALAQVGLGTVALDLTLLQQPDSLTEVTLAALREARLRDAGLVAGPIERLAELDRVALRRLAEATWPVVLTGAKSWDPSWTQSIPLVVELEPPGHDARVEMWMDALGDELPNALDAAAATAPFRLGPEQIERAAHAARLSAFYGDRPLGAADLQAGARSQNAAGLERLARRIGPRVGWADLILPERTARHVHEIAERAAQRERVLEEWRMGSRRAGDRGIVALFSGESGTGKTMAAEVLAGELGLELYTIDLATVVDKYVGETEKNLDRIFVEADRVNAVLFFDEADAIFGKRSEVKDAHDRYANVETAYLLQRLETFDGIAILATNLKANIDEAFARRLDAVVDFPMPDAEHRLKLWDHCLGPGVPRAPGLDLDFCAQAFELSGGNIRNIAFAASYLAAAGDGRVGMQELMRATAREYRKLGRLCTRSEFGRYYDDVSETDSP
jgi:winged helix domain-containing protein/ATPase family protein associated with various cellular activities (AAA)